MDDIWRFVIYYLFSVLCAIGVVMFTERQLIVSHLLLCLMLLWVCGPLLVIAVIFARLSDTQLLSRVLWRWNK